jgi:hypothetical protein
MRHRHGSPPRSRHLAAANSLADQITLEKTGLSEYSRYS